MKSFLNYVRFGKPSDPNKPKKILPQSCHQREKKYKPFRLVSAIMFLTAYIFTIIVFADGSTMEVSSKIEPAMSFDVTTELIPEYYLYPNNPIEEKVDDSFKEPEKITMGLFDYCWGNLTEIVIVRNCTSSTRDSWQNASIGLFAFVLVLGLLGIILAIFGICSSPLVKKLYYYHSAGEIFFICGLSALCATSVYLGYTQQALRNDEFSGTYGFGLYLGFCSALLFLSSCALLCLDEIYQKWAITCSGRKQNTPEKSKNKTFQEL